MNISKNFHSHTIHDKHGHESVEEVVKQAIKYGFKEWGFTGHIPLPVEDDPDRMNTLGELEAYVTDVKSVKEKYKDQIKIRIGIEADVINWVNPQHSMKEIHKTIEDDKDIDFVIIGHHWLPKNNTKEEWQVYIDAIEEYVKYSKKFMYLAHSDYFMFKFDKPDELSDWISKQIINLSLKYNFPLGVDFLGMYEKRHYPSLSFFKMAAKMNAKTIFEMDNHYKEIWKQSTFDKAYDFAKEAGITPINWNK